MCGRTEGVVEECRQGLEVALEEGTSEVLG